MKQFTKKPSLSELTLRERIGQTAAPIMTRVLTAEDKAE